MTTAGAMSTKDDERRARNLRTGLILASIALAFFLGFLLRRIYQ
jgi:hypothetical protein